MVKDTLNAAQLKLLHEAAILGHKLYQDHGFEIASAWENMSTRADIAETYNLLDEDTCSPDVVLTAIHFTLYGNPKGLYEAPAFPAAFSRRKLMRLLHKHRVESGKRAGNISGPRVRDAGTGIFKLTASDKMENLEEAIQAKGCVPWIREEKLDYFGENVNEYDLAWRAHEEGLFINPNTQLVHLDAIVDFVNCRAHAGEKVRNKNSIAHYVSRRARGHIPWQSLEHRAEQEGKI